MINSATYNTTDYTTCSTITYATNNTKMRTLLTVEYDSSCCLQY